MAVLKHLANKNANYGKALEYLMFQHTEDGKPVRNLKGDLLMRDTFIIDGINCQAFAFDRACRDVNQKFNKNQKRGEIKSHHYILSFDPRDQTDHGLTPERAQQLGMEFASRNFPGHQVLVCTHTDGHNQSGNIHVHMILNSVRKLDVERQIFMERDSDCRAGGKHHVTRRYFNYLLQDVMDMCQREGLYQVDLLSPAATRITEKEYRAKQRGQEKLDDLNAQIIAAKMIPRHTTFQTQKQFLRDAILKTAAEASSLQEFKAFLNEKYGIQVKEQRGVFSYLHPERTKYIRGRTLGTDYEKEHIQELIRQGIKVREQAAAEAKSAKARAEAEKNTVFFLGVRYSTTYDSSYNYYSNPVAILFVRSELQLVTDLQTCIKAQYNKAYAEKVNLSNLQKAARTVCYIQEHGIGSKEELREERNRVQEKVNHTEKAIKHTEDRLRIINEQIHYAGQYYSNKNVHKEYLQALSRYFYRSRHTDELDKYDEAVRYFKTKVGGKIPSINALKKEKEELLTRKSSLETTLQSEKRSLEELRTAAYNISWLLNGEKAQNRSTESICTRKDPSRRMDLSL